MEGERLQQVLCLKGHVLGYGVRRRELAFADVEPDHRDAVWECAGRGQSPYSAENVE
jgi:hypothetical protein